MLPMFEHPDGHYDDEGMWQRAKFCFIDCGASCTCKPPSGQYYSEAHDRRKQVVSTEAPIPGENGTT